MNNIEIINETKALIELNNAVKALQIANKQLESATNRLRQMNKPILKVIKD